MDPNAILSHLIEVGNRLLPANAEPPADARPFKTPSRALVIASYFIGDNIISFPLFKAIRRLIGPNGELHVVSCPAAACLFEACADIDDRFSANDPRLKNQRKFLEKQGYDTLFFCGYAFRWAIAAQQASIPQRVGFDLQRAGLTVLRHWGGNLTHAIPSTALYDLRSQMDVYLDMLRQLGVSCSPHSAELATPNFTLPGADHHRAETIIGSCKQALRILIHAGSGSIGKQWPKSQWENLLNRLHQQYQPIFYTTGSPSEAVIYETWQTEANIVNLCGQTSVCESIALMQRMDLVITLDTSTAHMAALAGTPRLIVLYGPTNHSQWRPCISEGTFLEQIYMHLPCQPCPARMCKHRRCMHDLSANLVLAAVERSFHEKSQASRPLSPSSI